VVAHALSARWRQPVTGAISMTVFTLIAWITWYLLSDPRGPVASFPYPFVMYLAMMILVGWWQHGILEDWPFQNLPQPWRGIVETVVNLIVTWFVIHVIFYRILGLGFNFLSQLNLETLAAAGKTALPEAAGKTLTLQTLVDPAARFAERAVVTFVLIGFFSYPFVTILFGKWPIRPSNLTQPQAGLAELGWTSLATIFFYTILIVPFWGMLYGTVFGTSFALNVPWWTGIAGTGHVHWVFGWWEWMIIGLFMTPNVWRMKPWTALPFSQPLKGIFSFACIVVLAYLMGLICVKIAPLWLSMEDVVKHLPKGDAGNPTRVLWYHAAEIAGFTLFPFLIWHHYFDDMAPQQDKDSWGAFWFRTAGVLVLAAISYMFFYYVNFGAWGLGNHHMEGPMAERIIHGESLIWNFWWIIPLLWNEWFFHKWPFYVHDGH
jgi:amino acid transporter, AAT family